MKAMRLLVILVILLAATTSRARISDPSLTAEQARAQESWVNESVKTWVDQGVAKAKEVESKVKSWWAEWNKPEQKAQVKTTPQTPTRSTAATQGSSPATSSVPGATAPATVTATGPLVLNADQAKLETRAQMQKIKKVTQSVKAQPVAQVATPGRKGKSQLTLTKSGVPLFPMQVKKTVNLAGGAKKVVFGRVEKVPKLDIGEEPTISRTSFVLPQSKIPALQVNMPAPLASPQAIESSELVAMKAKLSPEVKPYKGDLENPLPKIVRVTSESVAKINYTIKPDQTTDVKPVQLMSESEGQMLAALIMVNKGVRCESLLGLFDKLSKESGLGPEANFQMGLCGQGTKMNSMAFDRLARLVRSENAEYASDALELMVKAMSPDFEVSFSKLVRGLKNQKLIRGGAADGVYYYTAKGAFREGQYKEARLFAEKVKPSSSYYGSAQYVVSTSWYSLGHTNKAIVRLESVRSWLKSHPDKNLNSISAINLARMKFQQGLGQEALALYMAIDKDHPMWVQGLIEQGWLQLALDDHAGAIGNMYSLHSPYFKAVYKPESFAVRTIGYLNICQYPDAYKTLTWMEKEYRPYLSSVSSYMSKNKKASDYYDSTIKYLKGRSDSDTDGVPFQVVREMARQRRFLNNQKALNQRADETVLYDGVNKLIDTEIGKAKARVASAAKRLESLKAEYKKTKAMQTAKTQTGDILRQIRQERNLIAGQKYRIEILGQSKNAYPSTHKADEDRVGRESYALRESAGRVLVSTLAGIKEQLSRVLENNEFLRYEVFSGSGENIRFQAAGGKVAGKNRLPASYQPSKSLNWAFDGEYWEDEIGSYRSSLRNSCPESSRMTNFFKGQDKVNGAEEQAAVKKGEE